MNISRFAPATFAVGLIFGGASSVIADAGMSRWPDAAISKARLVAAGSAIEGARAAIHLELGEGWKTYWRTPGEAGMPPSFDWSRSTNLRSATVLWPAPRRFEDAGITSVGYSGEVVFPVAVVPEDADEPVMLDVRISFGICKDICIPREAHLTLALSAGPGAAAQTADDALIARFLARVPRMGEGDEPPVLKRAVLTQTSGGPRILVDVRYPEDAPDVDLFAEADSVILPLPEARGDIARGVRRFEIPLSPADAEALMEKPIHYTIVAGDEAREAVLRLGDDGPHESRGFAGP